VSAFRVLCFMAVLPIPVALAGLTAPAAPEATQPGVSAETVVPAGPAKSIPDPPPIITDIDDAHRYDSAIPGITRTGDGATKDHALPADTPVEGASDVAIDAATLDEPMSPELRDKFRETWNLRAERARLREQKRKEHGIGAAALESLDEDYPDGRLSRPSYRPERRYLKRFRSHFRVAKRARWYRSHWPHRRGLWKHLERGINAESPLVPHLPRVRPFGYHEYNGPWPWEREEGVQTGTGSACEKARLR